MICECHPNSEKMKRSNAYLNIKLRFNFIDQDHA